MTPLEIAILIYFGVALVACGLVAILLVVKDHDDVPHSLTIGAIIGLVWPMASVLAVTGWLVSLTARRRGARA